MTPIPSRNFHHRKEKPIPTWVPLAIIAIFFLLIFGGTILGVRVYAVYKIWMDIENWDSDKVLIQHTKFSCVPCSIVMLLKDEGIEVTAAKVAWIAGTDTKGTTPAGILKAGKYYGFDVREVRMGFDEFMDEDAPAVIEFTYDGDLHAVYARPDMGNRMLIVKDPTIGLLEIRKTDVQLYFGSDEWDVFIFEPETEY